MFWNKTITLYNRYEDELTGKIQWYRHKINDCFVKATNNTVTVGNVKLQTDDNIIRIPLQNIYLAPHLWKELPNDKKQDYLTISGGDLIFLGEVTETIDEYTAGKRSSDLIAKYKSIGSVFVNSININDFLPGAHYLVRGE